ncbi:MAG: hypothetical protein AB7F82_02845 [Alphaproteobacteria bacterium]
MKEKIEEEEKTYSQPVWDEFNENVHRIRRNLLIFSSILAILKIFGLEISNQPFMGIPVKGLSTNEAITILAVITLYHLIHYAVVVWTYYLRWSVRVTSQKPPLPARTSYTRWTNADSDLQQSNLYSWWLLRKEDFESFGSVADHINSVAKTLDTRHHPSNFEFQIDRMEKKFDELKKLIIDKRIIESLEEFNKWFFLFQKAQGFRWIIIEVMFPLYFGIGVIIY